jgi:uncharacterized protein YihD (DUF1040 family)
MKNNNEEVLKQIKKIWNELPELRLMQLLLNSMDPKDDHYYITDNQLINRLKSYYKHYKCMTGKGR